MAHSMLNRVLEHEGLSKEDADDLRLPKLIETKTANELSKTLKSALTKIKERL